MLWTAEIYVYSEGLISAQVFRHQFTKFRSDNTILKDELRTGNPFNLFYILRTKFHANQLELQKKG